MQFSGKISKFTKTTITSISPFLKKNVFITQHSTLQPSL